MLDEFQDLSLAQAMQTFDTSWWEIRRELDAHLGRRKPPASYSKGPNKQTPGARAPTTRSLTRYLDAATEQARAMSSAVDALRGQSSAIR